MKKEFEINYKLQALLLEQITLTDAYVNIEKKLEKMFVV